MKILALENELLETISEKFKHFSIEEAHQVWELYQAGLIREIYFRADQQTAVLILECCSTDEASSALSKLPYVREGLITFELIPLIAYSGFERLFSNVNNNRE